MVAPNNQPTRRPVAWVGAVAAIVSAVVSLACGTAVRAPRHEPGCDRIRSQDTCSILFLGNSYTAGNDLPRMLEGLAGSAGFHATSGALTRGGTTLADHLDDPETVSMLEERSWNVVVLQEASGIPSVEALRQNEMYPAARALTEQVRRANAQPVLFSTWAYSLGWPERGLPDYASMQAAVDGGYAVLGRELDIPLAPVGVAWSQTLRRAPEMPLWTEDGSHPSLYGSYLAACVLYAAIFRRSPQGLDYHSHLPAPKAAQLQAIAWSAVAGAAGRSSTDSLLVP